MNTSATPPVVRRPRSPRRRSCSTGARSPRTSSTRSRRRRWPEPPGLPEHRRRPPPHDGCEPRRDTEPAMSQANVEVVRRIWEADRRRDAASVRADYAADVEWEDNTGLWGDWGTARGPDGIQAAWRRWYEAVEDVRFEWDAVADSGDDVVVTYRTYARGRGSGAVVDQAITLLWTLRAGKVVRIRAYAERADGLEAAGLRE